MLRIVLSGPIHEATRVADDLAQAGFTLLPDVNGDPSPHDYGFDGEAQGVPVRFLSVDGEDVDKAAGIAAEAGWRLRGHWTVPEPPRKRTVEERLALIGFTVAEMRELVA